ncbi:dihydrofolate reductase-like [Liolophura sinensis]|uniref:dihydrofolate reductase-like n=1 Tax=Liolophura sinensis TaxID=3198878 RepID=UPI003158062A
MTGAYDGTFNICVAMCDGNRGIGLAGHHPWPSLPSDFRYYMTLTGTPNEKGKVSVNIKGRVTWEGSSELERHRPGVINILISRKLKEPPDEAVESVFPTLQDAVDYLSTSAAFLSMIDTVWIMGGEDIYREAINHPACKRIYLTRIYGSFPSDRFLAGFENKFQQIDQ